VRDSRFDSTSMTKRTRPPPKPKRPRCFVYVLGANGKGGFKTYVGWTTDLDQRLAAHNTGKGARTTRGRIWTLLYAEPHKTRSAAMSREWHLKRDRAFRSRLKSNRGAGP
jgi:putative endonuclease